MLTTLTVPREDPRLGRLLQLYLHEWSGRLPVPMGDDALFSYPRLEQWTGTDHEALLFLDGTRPLGFALITEDPARTWHVEELFILLGARRRGAGAAAVAGLLARHPGRWTLTVRPENPEALAFWRRVLRVPPVAEVGQDGVVRQRFTFEAAEQEPAGEGG